MTKTVLVDGKCVTVDMSDDEVAEIEKAQEEAYTAQKESDISDEEKLAILLATITEDKTNKGDNGTRPTVAVYDPTTRMVTYEPTSERFGDGTLDSPKEYCDGDTVEKGIYYCYYKLSEKGTMSPYLTKGVYLCNYSGTPTGLNSLTAFTKVQ